jgi:hypothetical protein
MNEQQYRIEKTLELRIPTSQSASFFTASSSTGILRFNDVCNQSTADEVVWVQMKEVLFKGDYGAASKYFDIYVIYYDSSESLGQCSGDNFCDSSYSTCDVQIVDVTNYLSSDTLTLSIENADSVTQCDT